MRIIFKLNMLYTCAYIIVCIVQCFVLYLHIYSIILYNVAHVGPYWHVCVHDVSIAGMAHVGSYGGHAGPYWLI